METLLVVGFYFQRVLRSFPFPLAQRMPLKYIFLSVLFHCIVFHGYTFAPRCTHLLLYSIPSNRFHIIWHVSSFLLVHAIRCKKLERIPSLFQSISKKLSVPHRIVFRFVSCGSDFIFFYPVWLNCARYVRALFDFVFLRFRMQSPTWAILFLIKLWSLVLIYSNIFIFLYRSSEVRTKVWYIKISN